MNKYRLTKLASAIILAAGLSAPAFAEDTSSAIRGSLKGLDGEIVTDATITVIHEPSGSKRVIKVNESGSFNATGLRVGGPYTVLIDSDAFKDKKLTNITIRLGTPFSFTEILESARGEVITITAQSLEGTNFAAGSSSTFNAIQIQETPSFNRDLKDIVRQNPLAVVLGESGSPLTIAGNNPKYNSLTVDGVRLDDDFGLAGNGYPTERSPISLDSIDQLTVVTSPFSVKYGGFSGGQISVVTKSGGNEFHGSVFVEQSKSDWSGSPNDPNNPGEELDLNFDEKTWGMSLSGPIIKDKLFFFASYETFEAPSQVLRGPTDSSTGIAPNVAAGVTQFDVDEAVRISRDVYGFDAGDWNVSLPLEDEKWLLKFDYNINDDHRASFAYSRAASNSAGNTAGGFNRLYLSSHWYNRSNEFDSYSAQLYSRWTDSFSTEIKVALKESVNGQVPLAGKNFGEVFIDTAGGGQIRLGPDDSRHANNLTNDTTTFRFAGEYLMGDHAISFGYEREEIDVFNLFVQHNLGSWAFDSLADYENQIADFFEYQNNVSLDVNDAAAEFTIESNVLFIEDNWEVNSEWTLNYGVRYERLGTPQEPTFNQNFFDRYGFSNSNSLDGKDIVLPRFGFNWSVNDDLRVYGGVGRYSGGKPNVWISNAYTNDGTRIALYRDFNGFANADPNTVPQEALDAISNSGLGDGNINVTDPDFELPSSWKYSIGADITTDLGPLGDHWFISGELIYNDIDQDVAWSDLSRTIDTSINGGFTVEGRPIYTRRESRRSTDIMLTNAAGGESLISTFTLANKWDNGIKMNFSYTNQDVQDRTPGTSSTASSNYRFATAYDRENLGVSRSSYEIEHRFLLNLSYTHQFFEGYDSQVHMIWERQSGRPFSWTLRQNRDDTGLDGNSSLGSGSLLPYLPTGPNDAAVDFANGLSYNEILDILNTAGISTAGGPLGRNDYFGPWITTMDLLFRQEVPGLMDGHKGLFYLDIKNAFALFDDDAAEVYTMPFGENARNLLRYEINGAGQYVYSTNFVNDNASPAVFRARESTWSLKMGVRYTF